MSMPGTEAEDLGPALAVEDALTVMVVILVLRVVLFVPMMNMDRARLDQAETETFWEKAYALIRSGKGPAEGAVPYDGAFDLHGKSVAVSEKEAGRVKFVEIADDDRNLLVIRHDLARQSYHSLFIQKFSKVPSFRHGRIKWSPEERKWFTLDNQVVYDGTDESIALEAEYRAWRGETVP